jgi:predicted Fe-Mo cluster-binding NifX family protein
MKIAVPSDKDKFAQHFGRCPEYTIIEASDINILKKEVIATPGHAPDYLPRFLKDLNVDVVLASGMGRKAKDLFDSYGIDVVTGAKGPVDNGVELYLKGMLKTEDDICEHGEGQHHNHNYKH